MGWIDRDKLSLEKRTELVRLLEAGEPINALALQFGVDRGTVYYYKRIYKVSSKQPLTPRKIRPPRPLQKSPRKIKIGEGKMYKDYLAEENEKRKKAGVYEYRV